MTTHRHRSIAFLFASISLAGIGARAEPTMSDQRPSASKPVPGSWSGGTLVAVREGLLRGAKDKEGTLVWKGVPYAAPPVRELRWKAPRPAPQWKGTRAARDFGPSSPQFFPILGFATGSEECLYLNVWRPADATKDLPVYVWIHGGGNSMGSANMVPDYYGHAVAARSKMVFVSINYRLGPFGWFLPPATPSAPSAPPATATSPNASSLDDSGNYGTLDIIAALAWIRDNIASFGGDSGNVTIAGESAGAMNVLSLLASPYAAGLFHRAVIESGSTKTVSVEEARAASLGLAAKLLVREGKAEDVAEAEKKITAMTPAELGSWLRSKKSGAILATMKAGATGMTGWPTIIRDGTVLPAEGAEVFGSGNYTVKVPLVIGSNREELKLFLFFDKSLDWKSDYYAAVAKYGSERWRAEGVDELATALAASPGQPPIYVYRFDWGSPGLDDRSPLPGSWGRRLGAFHTLEIPFFLGTETINGVFLTGRLFTAANRPGRRDLSAGIMRYLAAFARSGDPNPGGGDALPPWRARTPGGIQGIEARAAPVAAEGEPLDPRELLSPG
jgi:para-nitrobenzyl esterase